MGNRAQNLIYREEKKIIFLKIEKGKENLNVWKSHKMREEREIGPQNLENQEEKENCNIKTSGKKNVFLKSWKSRGEGDMKIHFSSSREKTMSLFCSRISRDWASCQGLVDVLLLSFKFGLSWSSAFFKWTCWCIERCTGGNHLLCSPTQQFQTSWPSSWSSNFTFSSAKKWHFGCRNKKTETTFCRQLPPKIVYSTFVLCV